MPTFPENRLLTAGKRDFVDPTVEGPAPAPDWWLAPASVVPLARVEDFEARANAYFQDCENREERATLTGFCVAIGLPGPTSLLRLGQRIPELRAMISRCCTRIAAGYEAMIGSGQSAGPLFMLKNIPDYDPEDPEGAPAVLFFEDRKEIVFTDVAGAAGSADDFQGDALETYLSIIKRKRSRDLRRPTNSMQPPQRRIMRILNPDAIPEDVDFIEGMTDD